MALPAAALAADMPPFIVTLPTVTGPIPSTPTNFPSIALGFEVEPPLPDGYVEEEFFVSGTGPCPAIAARGCMNLPIRRACWSSARPIQAGSTAPS
jgi:hypothetical protein